MLGYAVTLLTPCLSVSCTRTHTRIHARTHSHTHQINTDYDGDTEMLNVRPRAFYICLSSLQYFLSSSLLLLPAYFAPFLAFPWPATAIFSSNSPRWSIVSPPLGSSAASSPCPSSLPLLSSRPLPPHCPCETIGRCNI